MNNLRSYLDFLNEKKPAGAPDFHHSDAPDANGRFKELGIKDLAAWLIKTRKKDVKKISGSLTQQVVFNRNEDPKYAEKMEKVRKEVYKQLGRQDLIDNMKENVSNDSKRVLGLNEFKAAKEFDALYEEALLENDVRSLHFEIDPKKAEERKIALGKSQGEVSKKKQIDSADYSLRRFRKSINYGDGTYLGVFIPGSYDAAISTLGDGPHKKAVKKVKWNHRKYNQWLEDVASNGGAENAFDMAQNAKNEPGLIDWVKKNFRYDDPMQRIQWDIEGFAESVDEAFIGPFVFNDRMSDEELKAMYNGALDGYANYSKGFQHSKSDYKKAYQEIEKILKKRGVSVDESVVTEAESIEVGEYIKTQYGYFYKRVAGKVGGQEAFVEIKKGKEGKRKTSIHDTVDFDIVDKSIALSESLINEAKVNYDFSEDELKRVLKLLGRNASTEVKMIKAFEKAFGRKLTRDELFEAVNEAKNTIGLAFKEEQDYLDFKEFVAEQPRGVIRKNIGFDSKTKSWNVEMDVKVLDRIYGEGHPGNKKSGWYGGLPDDFESVIIESVEEAKMSKEKIESLIWSLENEKDSWHPSSASKKKSMLDKLKKDLSKFESVVTEAKNLKDMSDTDLIATLDHLKTGPANIRDLSDTLIKNIEKEIKRRGIKESVVNEAKAYKLKASEFGADTHSAPYNVKGEPTWRVHSTYAIDQVSGENNPEERDVVFFEAMPINNDIYIKIGGINNLKRSNGSTVGNNFGTTIEEWKNDPEGIAKEASEFLTDATHLKWINKKARSEGQTIKWALKDDYSSVIIDLVNKSLGLSESVDEVKRSMISGTSGRTISSLEYRKYELKKDVKDAKIGDFINVTLPKGTIIYNLPGGVFADHFALKQRYASRSSRGPQYFDKSTFKGIQIISKHDTLTAIEKNGKVLESVNEAKMPKKYIGNDEIVFLKTKEDSRGAHYNLYYKGHDIEAGGARFGSEKELEDFAANYILSNQWYKKLRYEDSIPLPEAFVGPFVFNDKMSDDELKAMYNGALDGYSYYAKGMQYPKSDYKKAYQEIEKILKKRGVNLNEAKLSTVHKAAKKGSYPAVIVVVQDGKVIHQEPVSTPDVAPATFNVMQKEYPKALLHLEDKTGKRLFSESVVTEAESVKVGEYIKTQYGYFYKRVDGKVGGQEAFVEIKKGKEGKRKTSIHNTVSFEIVDKEAINEDMNESKFSPLGYAKRVISGEINLKDAMKEAGISLNNISKLIKKLDKSFDIDTAIMAEGIKSKYIKTLNEYYGKREHDNFEKEFGKIKYPKWIKVKMKELVDGMFIDKLYAKPHNYMSLWLNQMGKRKFDTDERKKELGDVGYKLTDRYWHDLTGHTAFRLEAAQSAMEVSKHIQDMVANNEEVEPAYYLMKNYFNSFGMETRSSRIFNMAVEILEEWMAANAIETL